MVVKCAEEGHRHPRVAPHPEVEPGSAQVHDFMAPEKYQTVGCWLPYRCAFELKDVGV